MTSLQKLALDLGPLVVFLVSYYVFGVYWATGVFIVATLLAGGLSYALTSKVSPLMIFSGVFVVILGGLTIWLQNDLFIKLKPTIYYVTVTGILFGGLAFKRLVAKDVMEFAFQWTDEGWRKFTVRLGLFFAAMAVLNVWVAFTFSFVAWLWFKIAGLAVLSFLFFMSQMIMLAPYELKTPDKDTSPAA
jgi:intracellular septation protein